MRDTVYFTLPEGIKLVNAQIGDKGTLVLTFTDFAGIVTTATIAFE